MSAPLALLPELVAVVSAILGSLTLFFADRTLRQHLTKMKRFRESRNIERASRRIRTFRDELAMREGNFSDEDRAKAEEIFEECLNLLVEYHSDSESVDASIDGIMKYIDEADGKMSAFLNQSIKAEAVKVKSKIRETQGGLSSMANDISEIREMLSPSSGDE